MLWIESHINSIILVHLGADDQRTLLHQSDPQDPGLEPQTSQDTRPDACKLKLMI